MSLTSVIPPIIIGDTSSSGPGYSVVVTPNGALADDIVVTISRGANSELFVRLKAVR